MHDKTKDTPQPDKKAGPGQGQKEEPRTQARQGPASPVKAARPSASSPLPEGCDYNESLDMGAELC